MRLIKVIFFNVILPFYAGIGVGIIIQHLI